MWLDVPGGSAHLCKQEAAACGNDVCVVLSVTLCHLILANRECLNWFCLLVLIKMSRHAFTPHRTGYCGNSISPEGPGCVNVWYSHNIVFSTGTYTWWLNWEKCHANPRIKRTRFLCFLKKMWVVLVCAKLTATVLLCFTQNCTGPTQKHFRIVTCSIGHR